MASVYKPEEFVWVSFNLVVVMIAVIVVTFRAASCQEHQVRTEYPGGVPAPVYHHCEAKECE